jgi:cell shape-determining protein MreD
MLMLVRIIKFLVLAYVVAFCQTVLANITEIASVSPNYGTIIILLLVLKNDYRTAFPAAFMVALIIDSLNPALLGVGTAIRFSLAVAVWELKKKLDLDRIAARLYLLMGFEAVFQLLYQAFASRLDLGVLQHLLLRTSLPTLVYTTVAGLIVLMISDLSVRIEIGKGDRESKSV